MAYRCGGVCDLHKVLLGTAGAGKSASGSPILEARKSDSGFDAVVIHTPGYFDRELTHEQIVQKISRCIDRSSPGPHAIVLVMKVGPYTEEEKKTIERIQDLLGEEAAWHMMVLFIKKDELEDVSIRDNRDFHTLIERCGDRYCVLNYRAQPEEQEKQVNEVLTMMEGMVEKNHGRFYDIEMYQQAEKRHLEKLEERKRENKDGLGGEEDQPEGPKPDYFKKAELEMSPSHTNKFKEVVSNPRNSKAWKFHNERKSMIYELKSKVQNKKTQPEEETLSWGPHNAGIQSGSQRETGNTVCVDGQQPTALQTDPEEHGRVMEKMSKDGGTWEEAQEKKRQEMEMPHEEHLHSEINPRAPRKPDDVDHTEAGTGSREGELRLLLVGKSGGGKSSSGNTILGERKFDSSAISTSEATTCRKETVTLNGRNVVVVDTPGFFDTELTPEQIVQEIRSCVTSSAPGPHAIVLVVKIGRYTAEEKKTIERIQDTFGEQAVPHMLVLFTKKDELEDTSIQDYLYNPGNRDLQVLIERCGKRYCAFNNRATPEEREEQVNELLNMIEKMVQPNNENFYTNEMYQQAEKRHLEKLEERKRENRSDLEKEAEKLEQQFEEEVKRIQEEAKAREEEIIKNISKTALEKESIGPGQHDDGLHPGHQEETGTTWHPDEQRQTPPVSNIGEQQPEKGKVSESGDISNEAQEEKGEEVETQHNKNPHISANSGGERNTHHDDHTSSDPHGGDSALRLVLVGKSGAGKSASGNSILGKRKFDSSVSSTSEETTCRKETVTWKGRNVVVVDTPGFFDTELTTDQILQEISKSIVMSAPGPHAFVLVVKIGRYTEEEKRTIERIQDHFGEEAARHMMVLFTGKDELDDGSIENYLHGARSEDLQGLIQRCGGRHCAFNNRAPPEERDKQVNELLTMIERMVEQNHGSCYTHKMYQQAQKRHLEKLHMRQNRGELGIEVEQQKQPSDEEDKENTHSSETSSQQAVEEINYPKGLQQENEKEIQKSLQPNKEKKKKKKKWCSMS